MYPQQQEEEEKKKESIKLGTVQQVYPTKEPFALGKVKDIYRRPDELKTEQPDIATLQRMRRVEAEAQSRPESKSLLGFIKDSIPLKDIPSGIVGATETAAGVGTGMFAYIASLGTAGLETLVDWWSTGFREPPGALLKQFGKRLPGALEEAPKWTYQPATAKGQQYMGELGKVFGVVEKLATTAAPFYSSDPDEQMAIKEILTLGAFVAGAKAVGGVASAIKARAPLQIGKLKQAIFKSSEIPGTVKKKLAGYDIPDIIESKGRPVDILLAKEARIQAIKRGKRETIIENGEVKQVVIKPTPEELVGDLTERTIDESAILANRYPPTPPDPTLFHTGVDLRAAMESLGIPSSELIKTFQKVKEGFHSPDFILGKDVHGKRIYDTFNMADLEKISWSSKEFDLYKKASKGIRDGDALDTGVFKVRDNQLKMTDVLRFTKEEAAQYGISGVELKAIKRNPTKAMGWDGFLGKKFDYLLRRWGESVIKKRREVEIWNQANKAEPPPAKWLADLTESERVVYDLYKKKISDYVPHMFDRSELLLHVQNELQILNKQMTRVKPDSKAFQTMELQRKKLIVSLQHLRGGDPLLYDILPESVRFKFFEARRGMTGYQVSSKKAYRAYLNGIGRKIFDEPALRKAILEYRELPESLKPYANWHMREFMGYNHTNFERLFGGIKSLMWIKTLGFNPRSAVVNLTQRLNTIADAGPEYSRRGWVYGFTPEGKALFKQTGLAKTVPTVMMEGRVPNNMFEGIREVSGFMFSKIEEGNLKHAFLSNYLKLTEAGMPHAKAFPEAIKGAQKVQFRYGRVGTPRFLRGGGGVAFQFWSYPIKQIELMSRWAKENPLKLVGWLAMAEGSRKALDEFLHIDLSSALGLGLNYGELISAFRAIPEGDLRKIMFHLKQSGAPIVSTGGGLLPYGLGPAVETIPEALQNIPKVFGDEIPAFEALGRATEPLTISRIRQEVRAIMEGPEEGKYPIREPYGDTMLYREKPFELFSRIFLGRPSHEVEVSEKGYEKALLDRGYNELQERISNLIAEGKVEAAIDISMQYNIPISKESIASAMRRRILTREERLKLEKAGRRTPYQEYMRK